MSFDDSPKNGMKTEIDLYGDDNYGQHDEVVVGGDLLDDEEFKTDDHNESEDVGEGGGELETHQSGMLEDEMAGNERRQSEADDLLYDAVIADRTSPGFGSGRHSQDENGDSSSPSPHLSSGGAHMFVTGSGTMSQAQRKNSCYVGNLTWWTNDQDLTDAVTSLGINDLIDVKFYENRANGQSKGFALVSFSSENSVRICIEHLSDKQIHGQVPVVLPYTKQSLAQLEAATKKPGEKLDTSGQGTPVNMQPFTPTGRSAPSGMSGGPKGGSGGGSSDKNTPTFYGVLRIGGGNQNRNAGGGPIGMGGPPQMNMNSLAAVMNAARASMGMQPGPPGVMLRGNAMGPAGIMAPGLAPPGTMHGFPNMVRPQFGQMGPPGMGPPTQVMSRPPPHGVFSGGPPGSMMRGPSNSMHGVAQYTGAPLVAGHPGVGPQGVPPPGSHVNPNFYPGLAAAQQQAAAGHHDVGGIINEAEFEEIMNRNRTVSSSAISRAVSDAAAGDYPSAIETLVTALSLIRQSKVAHDDRCKVLIGSLQDTLHGIEAKSYGSGGMPMSAGGGGGSHHGGSGGGSSRRSKDRGSGRDRSRSRERASGSSKRRHRSRSRSRSRDRYADEYSPRRSRRY